MKPSIRPIVWSPPPAVRSRPKNPLPTLERIALPALGEDVVVDAQGRLIAGLQDGSIVRLDRTTGVTETLVNTGGRPIGIELDAEGKLIVCDAQRGLLRVDPTERRIEVLVDAGPHRIGICNNAAIANDGTIYFSDSSQRFGLSHWRGDILEHSGTGRLLARTPEGKVQVLLEGLQFANGVALASDESFVAVAESGAYRIMRVWLRGEKSGQSEVWVDNLPGFPDNMASDAAGLIWVALASPRNPLLDLLHRAAPLLRRIVWKLPTALQPKPERAMRVLALNDSGAVVRDLGGKSRAFHMVTGMRVHRDKLYLASIEEAALASLTLP